MHGSLFTKQAAIILWISSSIRNYEIFVRLSARNSYFQCFYNLQDMQNLIGVVKKNYLDLRVDLAKILASYHEIQEVAKRGVVSEYRLAES